MPGTEATAVPSPAPARSTTPPGVAPARPTVPSTSPALPAPATQVLVSAGPPVAGTLPDGMPAEAAAPVAAAPEPSPAQTSSQPPAAPAPAPADGAAPVASPAQIALPAPVAVESSTPAASAVESDGSPAPWVGDGGSVAIADSIRRGRDEVESGSKPPGPGGTTPPVRPLGSSGAHAVRPATRSDGDRARPDTDGARRSSRSRAAVSTPTRGGRNDQRRPGVDVTGRTSSRAERVPLASGLPLDRVAVALAVLAALATVRRRRARALDRSTVTAAAVTASGQVAGVVPSTCRRARTSHRHRPACAGGAADPIAALLAPPRRRPAPPSPYRGRSGRALAGAHRRRSAAVRTG